jgi:nucleoside recognition membrane protein YjiH
MLGTFTATEWVEVIAAVTLPLTVLAFTVQRGVRGGAIASKVVQIFGILLFLPALLILGIEKDITEPVIGVLLGAAGGYLLSNIGRESESAPRA